MSELITERALRERVGDWIKNGTRVAGPSQVKDGLYQYVPLTNADQLVLEGFIHPANSIKEFVFPQHETICTYRYDDKTLHVEDAAPFTGQQVIVAARPCDAASLPILDHVFNWDSQDPFYNARRQATTVVALACLAHDAQCFCTGVGLGPDSDRGADVLLLPLGNGEYEVRCVTDKGRALFNGATTSSDKTATIPAGPEHKIDLAQIRAFLTENYENPVWQKLAMRCIGCGACTYTCPTCHCFDIVDEGNAAHGCRVKNWDACQFGMFTNHASGHNPRPNQGVRQRQRIQHKFRIYPEKFGDTLCTGCGNCTRKCPVSLGVLTLLQQIQALRAGEKP